MGLCVGVFPGLGGIAGLSLLLPFMFGMDPVLGLALMIGTVAVVPTSDAFASVLMGIPGASASQATVLDGFPMAKRAAAARALSAVDGPCLVAFRRLGRCGVPDAIHPCRATDRARVSDAGTSDDHGLRPFHDGHSRRARGPEGDRCRRSRHDGRHDWRRRDTRPASSEWPATSCPVWSTG